MVRSSSKSIIKGHGGKIWAEVNLGGESATFSFSFSLRKYRYKTKRNSFIVIFYFAVRTKIKVKFVLNYLQCKK